MGAFSIPAQVKTPVPDSPLQTIGGLMQLRASLTEQALRQAQIAQVQQQQQLTAAETQQKQRDLADQNTIQEAQKDPQMARAFGEGDFSALAGKIQPKTLDVVTANNLTHQQTAATLSKEKLDENAKKHDVVEQGLTGLMGLDDAAAVAAYPALKSQLEADKVVPSGILPQTIQSKDDITALAAKNGYLAGVNSKAADLKEKQQKEATEAAQAEEASAKGAEARQNAALVQRKLQAVQDLTPGNIGDAVDLRIDPNKFPDQNKAAKAAAILASKTAVDPKEVTGAIEKVAQSVDEIQRKANPTEIAAGAAQAKANAQATEGVDIDKAVQTEIRKAKLAPGAVSEIQSPTLQMKVIGDYTKASDEYQGKVGDAARLKAFVDAARSGNQAAAALIPITEVREIVNRVTNQELQAVGGASLARRVENTLSTLGTGKPSEDTLRDVEQLSGLVQNAAKTTFHGKVNTLNTLGAKFPTEPVSAEVTPSVDGTPKVTHRYNQKTGKIEPVTQ